MRAELVVELGRGPKDCIAAMQLRSALHTSSLLMAAVDILAADSHVYPGAALVVGRLATHWLWCCGCTHGRHGIRWMPKQYAIRNQCDVRSHSAARVFAFARHCVCIGICCECLLAQGTHPLCDAAVQEGLPSSQHALRSEARLIFAAAAPHGRHTCAEPLRTAALHGAPPCAQ